MSAPALARFARLVESHRVDQRAQRRYPITLDIEYKLLSKGRVQRLGFGKTLNVSSGGACFECGDDLPPHGQIELVITWPFLLEGVCPLKLVMQGRIVRCEGQRVAVQARHHEFRTAGVRASRANSRRAMEAGA
jgi:hypothetical protein